MIRLAISVEGPTEREFVNQVLFPHFLSSNIFTVPIVVTTKRVMDGPNHKGGDISIDRVVNEIKPLIHSFHFVTTFYDFYGFKGKSSQISPSELAEEIRIKLKSPRNFIPYIQQYEFESLLLSDCSAIGNQFNENKIAQELTLAISEKGAAELVNDSPETCPSQRIIKACSNHGKIKYDKPFHGPSIAKKIGLQKIRENCPLFSVWIKSLEEIKS